MTSPPRPPSPPDGPPRGTNFSRRNATQPLPPSPALTRMIAWSMNTDARSMRNSAARLEFGATHRTRGKRIPQPRPRSPAPGPGRMTRGETIMLFDETMEGVAQVSRNHFEPCSSGFQGLYEHVSTAGALVDKPDHTLHLGKKRVIFSSSDIDSWFDARATLANDDCSSGHFLSAKRLNTEALRIRIASISGAA